MIRTALRSKLIQSIESAINDYPALSEAYEFIEPLVLSAFNCQRMSIFQRRSKHRDLVAFYKTGTETREIKVPINPHSIAGYVAMSQQALVVDNAYDDEALNSIHFRLKFDRKYDRLSHFKTKNVLCVPIVNDGLLLGVLELLNKEDSGFDSSDVELAELLSLVFATYFRLDLGGTNHPFEYLAIRGELPESVLNKMSPNSSIKKVASILETEYSVEASQIGNALSVYFQVPYIDFEPQKYRFINNNSKLNLSYLKRNLIAPLADAKGNLLIVMFEPNNSVLRLEIETALGDDNYQLAFSLPSKILQYLGERASESPNSEVDNILEEIADSHVQENDEQHQAAEDEPAIVRLVSSVLNDAKRLNASDVHIDPDRYEPTLVRMRVDGVVRDVNQIPSAHHNAVVARIKILSGLDISEKRVPQDGKLVFQSLNQKVEVRVATIPTVAGEGIVMRLLSSSSALPIDNINLSQRNLSRLKAIVTRQHGILLVVGPTGSGKTTTLHAVLGHLNTTDKKIWTAEDPVEISQYRLQQVQINPKVGFTFAAALRAFLRADPDIILIGEMRDKETAHAGIEASLTGHLVLSTLHTNSAPETISRLLDLGLDPVSFSDACIGVLAQRLIRTLCSKCKQKHEATDAERDFLNRHYGEAFKDELALNDVIYLYTSEGCEHCENTGYKGRTGVHELLTMTPDLRAAVYKKASLAKIKSIAVSDGMRTLAQDAVIKMLKGDIDISQAQLMVGSDSWYGE